MGNLEPLACTPLNIPANRLLLAPHTYGPDVYVQPYFNASNFPSNMPAIWDQHFGQFVQAGYAVMLGEFGGKFGRGDARDVQWQNALVDYMVGKGMRSGFYWSWNPNSGDTGGILDDDWTTVRTDKVQLLQRLWGRWLDANNTYDSNHPHDADNANPTDAYRWLLGAGDDGQCLERRLLPAGPRHQPGHRRWQLGDHHPRERHHQQSFGMPHGRRLAAT